ncbi:MAG: type II secretion system protein GspG [bacterium]|nr:type II secretion system protein GspG [bacterium]
MKKGFTLTELIIAVTIVIIVAAISLKMVSLILHKARVVSAKTQIAQLAQILQTIKDDTGLYPVVLSDILSKSPPSGMEKGWHGPYSVSIPIDPWKTPYFYKIPLTNVFGSPPFIRGTGKPFSYYFNFEATSQTATMKIENYGVASAYVCVNGTTIFSHKDFCAKPPHPQIYERQVNIKDGTNYMEAWLASQPTSYFLVYIYGYFPTKEYFLLGSYGRDRKEGGKGVDEDIVWHSEKYPNFQ